MVAEESDGRFVAPEGAEGPDGRLLVDGVPRQPREGAELDHVGGHGRHARHGSLAPENEREEIWWVIFFNSDC